MCLHLIYHTELQNFLIAPRKCGFIYCFIIFFYLTHQSTFYFMVNCDCRCLQYCLYSEWTA